MAGPPNDPKGTLPQKFGDIGSSPMCEPTATMSCSSLAASSTGPGSFS